MKQLQSVRKVAAAVTAVLQYIAEHEAVAAAPVALPAPPTPPKTLAWGMAGRQESMLFRSLWQRRLTKTW